MRMLRMLLLFTGAAFAGAGAVAQTSVPGQRDSDRPAAQAPTATGTRSLPEDRHEGLRVSVDPYADPARAKEKFGKANPLAVGILPVEIWMRNETPQPMHLELGTVQLAVHFESGRHQDIDWLDVQDVASEVAHPGGTPAPKARRFPVGLPSGTDKKTDKLLDILKPLSLDADIVPPMGTIHGFLFFDLSRDMSLAKKASLYVPDVTTVPSNKTLMFFEVPLMKE
jgi:hypothetical protein